MAARSGRRGSGVVRGVLAALALLVGVLGVRHSLGLALSGSSPMLAVQLDGENAVARAQAALSLVEVNPELADYGAVRDMARGALARDAGNVAALAALGLTSETPRQEASVFTAANRLSRRNLVTQMWMIEHAVARNDVPDVLRQYDIALRTSSAAPSVLFPILVSAVSDDTLRAEIARTLAHRPVWSGLYLQQLAQSGTDRHAIALLFADLKRRSVFTGVAADAALYDRLAEAQMFDDSWNVYAAGQRGAVRNALRNPVFADAPVAVTPFDWQLSDTDTVSARSEQVAEGRGQLVFSTTAGEGGQAARQMLVLTPGSYTLSIDVERIEAADAAAPYLRVACLPANVELLRHAVALQGRGTARFTVPADCRAQALTLVAQPASGLGTVTGTVNAIRIARAQ